MRLSELLLELNFNKGNIKQIAMASEIDCGFEVEVVWPVDGDYGPDNLNDLDWDDLQDIIIRQEGHYGVQQMREQYDQWVMDYAYDEVYSNSIGDIIEENTESWHYAEWIEEEGHQDTFDEWCKENDHDNDHHNPDIVKEFIDDEYATEAWQEWIREKLDYDGTISDAVFQIVQDEYGMDEWINQNDVYDLLNEAEIYIEEFDEENALEGIADDVGTIVQNYSEFNNYTYGGYHTTNSSDTSIWRIETDSSIDGGGHDRFVGVEIISPVFSTPEAMLEEMQMLFMNLPDYVETNDSTGLHVTMSMPDVREEPNKLKMALLLGEKHVLDLFSRRGNSYAVPHGRQILDKLKSMDPSEINNLKFDKLEKVVSDAMDSAKYRTIHFKGQKNDVGNELIEFRVAGGENYENDIPKIEQAITRYATMMRAGYGDYYKEDYAKALMRLVHKLTKESDEKAKENPAIKAWVAVSGPGKLSQIERQFEDLEQGGPMQEYLLYGLIKIAFSDVDAKKFQGSVNTGITRGILATLKKYGGSPKRFLAENPNYLKEYYILMQILRQPQNIDTFVDNPRSISLAVTNKTKEELFGGKKLTDSSKIKAVGGGLEWDYEQARMAYVRANEADAQEFDKTRYEKALADLNQKFGDLDWDFEKTGDPDKWTVMIAGRLNSDAKKSMYKSGILVY